jgi:Acetyltransferase (GNAT) domain
MTTVHTEPAVERAYGVELLRHDSAEWEACEASLAMAGVRLALPHRAGWAQARRGVESSFLALRTPDGGCAAGVGLHAAPSRALPGFRVLRVERLGEALPRALWTPTVDALADVAHRVARVLRLTVEVFSRDGETRARLGEQLAGAGFARAPVALHWGRTLVIDLGPSESELFASFSPLARRAVRSVARLPVQVRSIEDHGLGDRLEALSRETLGRTGGRFGALWNWAGVIELSRRVPDAARLVGLFRTDRAGPDALLGFAWGWWNGESVSYFAGASSRPTDLHGVSIGHPLMWHLITWAKGMGARWFDLGGVTAGTLGSADPLGGISDFKRLFSKQTAEVAEDWVLEPHVWPARVAAVVSGGAAWLSRTAHKSGRRARKALERLRPRGPTAAVGERRAS